MYVGLCTNMYGPVPTPVPGLVLHNVLK